MFRFPKKIPFLFDIISAFCLVYGYGFHNSYKHPLLSIPLGIVFLLLTIILTVLFDCIMKIPGHPTSKNLSDEKKRDRALIQCESFRHKLRRNITAGIIMVIGWIPYWLAAYPGFFTYDATNAFIQHFYGIEYSTHHPLFHSIVIADVFKLMLRLIPDNYNAGVVALSFLTMLMGVMTFLYMLDYVYNISSKAVYITGVIYLSFFPTIGLFSSCSTKDTFTAFFLILFIVKLLKMISARQPGKIDYIILIFFITMMLLYRKNILIAYLMFVFIFCIIIKQDKIRWITIFCAGLFGYMLCNSFFENKYHPAHGEIGEMLCVPLQQMARVYINEGDAMFTEAEEELFNLIHPYSLTEYHELNADYVKHDMNDEKLRENLSSFLLMWIRIGLHHPIQYAEAFLVNTYQAWYPFCDITGYADKQDHPYEYFKCDVEAPGELKSKFPQFYEFLYKLCTETSLYKIPVIGILFSIGFYMFILMFTFFYGIYKKSNTSTYFSVFLLTITFTSMCGPLVLPRYYIYLFYTFPMMIAFIVRRESPANR